ncbi:AC4 protein [Sweet potato leaf curl virus]|uniref:AC4 protein n=1 Tax=Sweet potato leaf curl virus TaxID=100755 RepID=B3Y548_9GEMI|nr:AC4 protein [Sweet potato leaf curl virus]
MKMGNLISTCYCSSKGTTNARIRDSSTLFPHQGRLTFTPTSRELNPAPMSSPTSIRTATQSNGVSSRSTADLLEEVSRLLTTQPQRR